MKKLILIIFLAIAGLLGAKEIIKIGVILPLTGNMDVLGQPIRELIQYKIEHFPKDSRFEYKVFFEDDQATPKLSLLAAHRLVELEHVDVLVSTFSSMGAVVAPFATQAKVPHLMWSFKNDSADGIYNFNQVTPMGKITKLLTDSVEQMGYHKIAFLIFRNAGGEMILKKLNEQKVASKLEWVSLERFNPGERDFRMILEKIRTTNPDVFCVYAWEPEVGIILHQMQEIGWKVPTTSISSFQIDPKDPYVEGKWFVSDHATPQEYVEWFQRNLKKAPNYGVDVYDNHMQLIYDSFENCPIKTKKPGPEEITKYWRENKNFPKASGPITYSGNGIFETQPAMMLIKNGVPVKMGVKE